VAHLAPFDTVVHIDTPSGALTAKLATAGLHNAQNATAAAAAACAARVSLDAVRRGLESFAPVAQRMQRRTLETGGLLIDDSYNANPDSVRAAIGVLGTLPGPTLLILGDMGELGENAEPFHAEVGAYARTRGVTALYATGPLTRFATDAFGEGSAHFEDAAEVIAATRQWLLEPDHDKAIVLVKGSRFMAMEKVVQALAPQDPPAASPGTH
jgi:UDP-N-acetylmuramyl pentapeptide synthase